MSAFNSYTSWFDNEYRGGIMETIGDKMKQGLMTLLAMVAAGLLLVGCGGSSSDDDDDTPAVTTVDLPVDLSARQQVDRILSGGSASGTLTVGDDGSLSGTFTVSGLTSAISNAHIHSGYAGGTGGPIVTLDFDNTSGTVSVPSGTVLTTAQLQDLQAGSYYVNVHTDDNGGGEIRGQITPANIVVRRVDLSEEEAWVAGSNATRQSAGAARGWLTINTDDGTVQARMRIRNLTPTGPTTGVHIHHGGGLLSLAQDSTDTELWSASGTLSVDEFNAGSLYFNIHTAANTGGELRGQIGSPTTHVQVVELSSEAAWVYGSSDFIDSSGSADGVVTVNRSTNVASATVRVEGVTPTTPTTGVHLHHSGGIVTLDADSSADIAGTTLWSGSSTIVAAELDEPGTLYLNIHSAAAPAGELRGPVYADHIQLEGARVSAAEAYIAGTNLGNTTTAQSGGGLYVDTSATTDNATAILRVTGFTPNGVGGTLSTGVHVHNPTGIVIELTDQGASNGTYMGTGTVNLAEYLNGELYFNVHGAAPNTGGEIRGQIPSEDVEIALASPDADQAQTAGTNVSGTSAGSAEGIMIVNEVTGAAVARLRIDGITPVGVHVHFQNAGTGLVALTEDSTASNGSTLWTFADGTVLDGDQIDDFDGEDAYFNIHTTGNPNGELRGQLVPD